MITCPFKYPEEAVSKLGDQRAWRRRFDQREGLAYASFKVPGKSGASQFSWPFRSFMQIVFLSKGRISISLPDMGKRVAGPGEWFAVSLGDWMGSASLDGPIEMGVIECSKEIWQELVTEEDALFHARKACFACHQRQEAILTKGPQDARMRALSAQLFSNEGSTPCDRLLAASATLELLARVCGSNLLSGSAKPEPCVRDEDEDALASAAIYLEEHLHEEHSLAALSRKFALNEFKLKRGFRERFGSTVFGYLRQRRMDRARQLLASRKCSVLEAANAVGYSNPSHFARAFRESFGVNPKSFLSERVG